MFCSYTRVFTVPYITARFLNESYWRNRILNDIHHWQRFSFLSVLFCLFVPLLSRLCQELALFDQRQEDKAFMVKKETVRISDDYSLLSQTLDDLQFTSI